MTASEKAIRKFLGRMQQLPPTKHRERPLTDDELRELGAVENKKAVDGVVMPLGRK